MSQIAAQAMPPADESSRDSLVVVQQPAKALTPTDPSLASTQRATVDEPVPEPLMIPLAMVVLDEFRGRSSKVALTKRYKPIEALEFDRPHEAFSVRVRIGRLKRRLHDMYARRYRPTAVARPDSTFRLNRRSVCDGRPRERQVRSACG